MKQLFDCSLQLVLAEVQLKNPNKMLFDLSTRVFATGVYF